MKSAVSFGNLAEIERFGRETKGFFQLNVNVSSQFLHKEQTKLCLKIHRKNIIRFCVVFTSEMCKKRTDSEDFTRGDSMETSHFALISVGHIGCDKIYHSFKKSCTKGFPTKCEHFHSVFAKGAN